MEVHKLAIDKVYQTPSGLGGLFDVKYLGKVRQNYLFKNVTPFWDGALYTFSECQVISSIHLLKGSAKLSEILQDSQRN